MCIVFVQSGSLNSSEWNAYTSTNLLSCGLRRDIEATEANYLDK
jgi:hypothetical protein